MICPTSINAKTFNTTLNLSLSQNEIRRANYHFQKLSKDEDLKRRYRKNPQFIKWVQNQLEKSNLDKDFAYIIIVESNLNHKCNYRIYRGLWQIEISLGKKFGLKSYKDLYDPYKSTQIAINYLLFLKKLFNNDHRLMIYAYNFGETRIKNLIKKYGKDNINKYLPHITKNYIPKLLAGKAVIEDLDK